MTAVGKFNPNSTIKEYVQDLRAAQLSSTSESDKVCTQIANILPRDEYLAWVDAGPESNAAFLKYAQEKLQSLNDAAILQAAHNAGFPNAVFVETEMSLIDRVHMVHGEAPEPKFGSAEWFSQIKEEPF